MKLNFYIYYRVAPSAVARTRAMVEAIQSALALETGIRGSLLRREDDASTWMEIYENVGDRLRFEGTLDRLLAQYGYAGCAGNDSKRHTECFVAF